MVALSDGWATQEIEGNQPTNYRIPGLSHATLQAPRDGSVTIQCEGDLLCVSMLHGPRSYLLLVYAKAATAPLKAAPKAA